MREEFKEIGHCGGQFTIKIKTDQLGQKSIQFGMKHSRSTPAAMVGVYALPQGTAVAMIQMGGLGQAWNPAPPAKCLPIFMASDTEGMFGHECPNCKGYWRSNAFPSRWPMTCAYCGVRRQGEAFLTQGQQRFIEACCETAVRALANTEDGEYAINMDEIADLVGKDIEKPKFYYSEQSQQNRFKCKACGAHNDVLGRYAYCSSCGTHNGLQELTVEIEGLRGKIVAGGYENTAKQAVGSFDSFARQFAKQLSERVPMTKRRQKEWARKLFHALGPCADALKSTFDISLFGKLSENEVKFAILMFHRRHVYEHNGGEADQKYIDDSGDTSVRPKQVIRETEKSSNDICDCILKLATNYQNGFHEIFPPETEALEGTTGK